MDRPIDYRLSEPVSGPALAALMDESWPDHAVMDPKTLSRHAAGWVCAYDEDRLVGFVNLAWDGATHFFLLDTTVAPSHRRRGVGARLVAEAVSLARSRDGHWLHVDYDDDLASFYDACGFQSTPAGMIQLYD